MKFPGLVLLLGVLWLALASPATAEPVATRYGLGLSGAIAYDPGGARDFLQLTGFALFDYETVWRHPAPEPLRFKVEGNAGVTTGPHRTMVSVNVLAHYRLVGWANQTLLPYAEAGIGVVYSDYRVKGQGLRFNFNPQAGIGLQGRSGVWRDWFVALRLHHVSNGDLHDANRGINSALLQVGRLFDW
ncbi:MAG: acyloxyacyl hydrolase [Desulfuromonas sp.]|nr:MAG: acyloxyacyl hydrolase [Desulfuromonas sp.]